MKNRTKSLYDEWSRIDAMRKPGKTLLARKRRIGVALIRTRAIEDRELSKLSAQLKKL